MQNAPESHEDENAFGFPILFSAPVTAGFQALNQHCFDIAIGTIESAIRVDERNA